MHGNADAEEYKRILSEAAKAERERLRMEKKTPGWIQRIADSNPEVIKIRGACDLIASMVEKARLDLKLPEEFSLLYKKKKGRPCEVEHPLPRRDTDGRDPIRHVKDHSKRMHVYYYQEGCDRCYMREFLYYKNNPDKRPKGVQTAGTDELGRVKASRIYQPGWDPERYPFKA